MSREYLAETPMLNFSEPEVQSVLNRWNWRDLSLHDRIGKAHDFVRNDIAFGYNAHDMLPATAVLTDGYGQCNTKATLLMALLRGMEIPCRLHGFTIDRALQRGVVPEPVFAIAPRNILHSWVEVRPNNQWIVLEGFILDDGVLTALQKRFPDRNALCAYGAGTNQLQDPPVTWSGQDTYIQQTGINNDFGVFDAPDDFYANHRQLRGLRGLLYRHAIRHWMNRRVAAMRRGRVPDIPATALVPWGDAPVSGPASTCFAPPPRGGRG